MAQTVGSVLTQVKEMKNRAAVYRGMVQILRTRYLPRDGAEALAQMPCDGAPVPAEIIEEVAENFEEEIAALEKEVKKILSGGVT